MGHREDGEDEHGSPEQEAREPAAADAGLPPGDQGERVQHPHQDGDGHRRVLVVTAVIVAGKALIALAIVRLLGGSLRTGLTVAVGLAQIGEFSFILAEMGIGLGLLPTEGRDLILAGALVSITLNPLVWRLLEPIESRLGRRRLAVAPGPS